jgi:hypothetical protein
MLLACKPPPHLGHALLVLPETVLVLLLYQVLLQLLLLAPETDGVGHRVQSRLRALADEHRLRFGEGAACK